MFKQRLFTALVLIPLILAALYFGNYLIITAISLLLVLACGLEWMQLAPLSNVFAKFLFIAVLGLCCFLIQFYFKYWLYLDLILWPLIISFILTFPKSQKFWGFSWVVTLFCLILLPLFAQAIINIFQLALGRSLLVYLLCLVWAADIGAYLLGKHSGKHKLIPSVSPGKTWEGVFGGLLLTLFISLLGYYYFSPGFFLGWFFLAISIFIIALFGDLFISLLKRRVKLKDTGQLLPGHGGILDRLDSLIAAAPFFYLGIQYLIHGG